MDAAGRGYADTPPHDTGDSFAPSAGAYDRDLPVPAASTALMESPGRDESGGGSGGTSAIQEKITQRPLLSIGAGLIGGMVLGGLMGGGSDRRHESGAWSTELRYPGSQGDSRHDTGSQGGDASSSSMTASMTEGLRNAAKQSGLEERSRSAATSVASSLNETLRSVLSKQLPGFDEKLRERQQEHGKAQH